MAPVAFAGLAVAVAVAAAAVTWTRLFVGMDLQDESFYVLIPWRWALGDRPFVNEQNLVQIASFLEYPFVKLFALVRGDDVTGLVLYTRHLYLLMMLGVAAATFFLVRRLVRWELALAVAAVFVTWVYWSTPQLSYNTMALAGLTLGTVLELRVILEGRGRAWSLAAGTAFGAAVVAYPSLLFVLPFYGVFLAFAHGRRATAMLTQGALVPPPDSGGPPTGPSAWRSLSAWALGMALVVVPVGLVILSFGVRDLTRCWEYTMGVARGLQQLGGASKAVAVAEGFWRLFTSRPYLIAAALVVYVVYRRWPRLGRALLAALPAALWLAGQRPILTTAGFVAVYAVLAPYLYLFLPAERREAGARLLMWAWAPSMIAAAMVSYTSALGYVNSPVGFAPALVASGLFLAWALAAVQSRGAARPWLALAVLVAVVGVTVAFQFQHQQRHAAYSELTERMGSGPWWGIKVTPERKALLDTFANDLRAQSRPGDQLLVFYQACGFYLYWDGAIAANTYWLSAVPGRDALPPSTVSYYRRHRLVPTLVVHLLPTAGLSDEEVREACGGLDYPPALVRPEYAFQRKPPWESTAAVLAGLPRR